MLNVNAGWTDWLRSKPETGMGYQLVQVPIAGVPSPLAVIWNGRFAAESREGVGLVMESAAIGAPAEVRKRFLGDVPAGARVLTWQEARRSGLVTESIYKAGSTGSGASAHPVEQALDGERFLRYSAYRDDIRINADGSVSPGTYVTTHEDGMGHVRTGMDAVRRYALPNADPAVNRFYLRPTVRIEVRRGVVQPANGQPGGGNEVIFEIGAPKGTRYDQDTILPGS